MFWKCTHVMLNIIYYRMLRKCMLNVWKTHICAEMWVKLRKCTTYDINVGKCQKIHKNAKVHVCYCMLKLHGFVCKEC